MSSNLMIRRDHRGYGLVFLNTYALSNEEIEEIFGKFGQVISITATGNAKGYRFVRYASYDEAENALEGLVGHTMIKLCGHRYKNKATSKSETKVPNKRDSHKPRINVWEHENSLSAWETTSEASSYGFHNASFSHRAPSQVWQKRPTSKHYFDEESLMKDLGDITVDNLPDLMDDFGRMDRRQPSSLDAAVVVVGNIHPAFGEAYILHLFERHTPLAVTFIEYTPITNRRYCYVYFHKRADAEDVERLFDNWSLMGLRLVVMQPRKLMLQCANGQFY